jgi:hypothetical protein
LIEALSGDELVALAFDHFRAVHERFAPGMTKDQMAQLLLETAVRQREVERLLTAIERANPGQYGRYAAFLSVAEPGTPAAAPSLTQEIGRSAGAGLLALVALLQEPSAREAVIVFRTDFQVACQQIAIVNAYKRLHDLFQDLDANYKLLEGDRRRLSSDTSAWEQLALQTPELESCIENLLDLARQPLLAVDECLWPENLTQIRAQLCQAIEEYSPRPLESAVRRLGRLLEREPSRSNTRLVAAVKALRLTELLGAMRNLHRSLAPLSPDSAPTRQFAAGIADLGRLSDTLVALVNHHSLWQELDDELHRIEGTLDQDPAELASAWPDVKQITQALGGPETADWAAGLHKSGTELENALAQGAPPARIRLRFNEFRSRAGRRFRQVDDDLLALCNELQKVGESLNVLLQAME